MPVLECVPNISEGRDGARIAAIAQALSSAGVPLLDRHSDADHHRTVFTYAGDPDRVLVAAHAVADAAVSVIDIRTHVGVHPRIGAIDVVPFVPIADLTLADAAAIARTFARQLSERHGIPTFLYEAAAADPGRAPLEVIRRGGLPALAARMRSAPGWQPDFGPARPHPTAGVAAVGARFPLIAWNVELATDRLDIAQTIAAAIRQRSGGLPAVKALGLPLAARGIVQVSMNLVDYRQTSLTAAFDRVLELARSLGVEVLASELVGLAPAAALDAEVAAHIRLRGFSDRIILERRLGL
jgi:glutamate formiminotransferase